MDKHIEQLLRESAASLGSDWLTESPFQMSELRIEKVGFAQIPVAFVMVVCPPKAITAMVPVVRQFIFRELEAAGIENEILEFTPTVQDQGRRRRFVDCNEHSPTKGKNKVGRLYRFAFEIKRPFVGLFQWGGFAKAVGRIPERPSDDVSLGLVAVESEKRRPPKRGRRLCSLERHTNMSKFPLGQIVATPAALEALADAGQTPDFFLDKHVQGDWGEVPPEDKRANEEALVNGERLLSAYRTLKGVRIWIITEADRSSTCVLKPEEY